MSCSKYKQENLNSHISIPSNGLSTSSKSGSLFGGKSTFLSDTTPLISKNESKPAPSHLFGTSLWNTGMETSLFGTTTSQSNKTAAFNIGKKDAKNP